MGKYFSSIICSSVCIIIGCVSYDKPVIYHKNFQPGSHPLLRFDGWYIAESKNNVSKPIFLYSNGSAWFAEQPIQLETADELIKAGIAHSWGNFQINADTILVERFHQEEKTGNFNRIIMKGIVGDDQIHWIERTFHKDNPEKVNYVVTFQPRTYKPDSTKNWTRTHPTYNK